VSEATDLSEYMSIRQAAAHLGIQVSAVYGAVQAGKIRTEQVEILPGVSRRLLFKTDVLDYKPRRNKRRGQANSADI
jgi:excisionase family DNA binding protein